jgi:predicted MFS family arabinose efflux permease
VDTFSWRWVFLLNVPVLAAAAFLLARCVPETRDETAVPGLDWPGAALAVLGLGGTTLGMIEGPVVGWTSPVVLLGLLGGSAALALFVLVEARQPHPIVPLRLFRSRTFAAANPATLGIYGALSAAIFFVAQYVQNVMGYSATLAGAAFLPISLCLLALSPRFGSLAGCYGPRPFMTVGPLLFGLGIAWLAFLRPESSYVTALLPAAVLMGLGLASTVAPLTATVMGAMPGHNAGVASAVNNAASRVAGLLAIAGLGAVLALGLEAGAAERARAASPPLAQAALAAAARNPAAALASEARAIVVDAYTAAFQRAMLAAAGLALAGALIAFLFVRHTDATTD